MEVLKLRTANEIEIEPAHVKGYETHGLSFFIWHNSIAVGAQCKFCNTIVWVDQRKNSILNEDKPNFIPDHGPAYRAYYQDNIQRFLSSLPVCPKCHNKDYDQFVNNVTYPRFEDGTLWPEETSGIELVKVDPSTVNVWWYDK